MRLKKYDLRRIILIWFWISTITLCVGACVQCSCHACVQAVMLTCLPKCTMCFYSTTKCTFLCVWLSRPDMQEFKHELYIAKQQPCSGPCSQTNNGQHDNSIMKRATWPPQSRGAVTPCICIWKMSGLIAALLAVADIKKMNLLFFYGRPEVHLANRSQILCKCKSYNWITRTSL